MRLSLWTAWQIVSETLRIARRNASRNECWTLLVYSRSREGNTVLPFNASRSMTMLTIRACFPALLQLPNTCTAV